MEEQKKNNGEQQKRKPRRHGYFMEPPVKDNAPQTQTQTQNGAHGKQDGQNNGEQSKERPQQPRRNNEKQNAHSGHGNHGNRHKNDKRQGDNRQKQEKPQANDTAEKNNATHVQQKQENVKTQQNNGAAQGAEKKNRNRHGKKGNRPQQQTEDKTVETRDSSASAQTPQKRDGERRRTSGAQILQRPTPNHSADDYEEYKLVVDDEPTVASDSEPDNAPKTEIVGIRFKSTGKVYYFDPMQNKYSKGSGVIVDTARGQEYGEVAMANAFVNTSDIVPPLRPVLRAATAADTEHHKANKQKEEEAFKICSEKITAHKLDMKLIDAQYTFDNSKLLFYFTSSDRVDFRNLVKDLASVFRTRIELRQIGIRDEAKIMGGLGICGRPLCCTLFLSDFDQVSIKMAKEQNLSLNSAKISGICGRLMCCLKYEHEAYEYEIKRTPPVDSLVRTENGDGVVTEISPLQGTIKVRLLASPEIPPKTYKRDDVTMLRKKQK